MKKMILTMAIVSALVGVPQAARAAMSDDDAIKQIGQNFVTAWNAHDPRRMAEVFAEDGDLLNPFGVSAKSRAEAQKLFESEQAGVMKASTYAIDATIVRKLDADVAVSDWQATVTGMVDPGSGSAMPPFSHHVTIVYQKRGGKWQAVVARAFQSLPMPGGAAK